MRSKKALLFEKRSKNISANWRARPASPDAMITKVF
jgi:hypothetical protein